MEDSNNRKESEPHTLINTYTETKEELLDNTSISTEHKQVIIKYKIHKYKFPQEPNFHTYYRYNKSDYKNSPNDHVKTIYITRRLKKSDIRRYWRARHGCDKPIRCKLCDYKFAMKSSLLKHMRTHIRKKQHECIFCDYKCSQLDDMQRHLVIHYNWRQYECNFCDYKTFGRIDLRIHLFRHDPMKPFQCNLCGHKYTKKSDLERHALIHGGEKPFQCNFCVHKFSQKQLETHLPTHSKDVFPLECIFVCLPFNMYWYIQDPATFGECYAFDRKYFLLYVVTICGYLFLLIFYIYVRITLG